MTILLNIFLWTYFLLGFSISENPPEAHSPIRILFIGNSLTYTNNLPAMVQEIGKRDSVQIGYTTIALPNYSLEDHWNNGNIQTEITEGNYDFVVAQQGPSAQPASQVLLIAYAKKMNELCKKNDTRLCLFTVWPSKQRSFDLDGVIASYKTAAEQTKSLIAPAGLSWKYAWQKDSDLPLYGPDEFHPSIAGSFLAALTIYASLKEKKDLNFLDGDRASLENISQTQTTIFKAAVLKALEQTSN